MENLGIPVSHWGVKDAEIEHDSQVIEAYKDEINILKAKGSYQKEDLVALSEKTPGLDEICSNFSKEHHHTDDEVRFVVEGEGVFEVYSEDGKKKAKITCQAGDFIVIPAYRRHLFYLTAMKRIRCIRLFKDSKGWEAIYKPVALNPLESVQ